MAVARGQDRHYTSAPNSENIPAVYVSDARRRAIKHALPALVHLVRFGRLLANQIRFPVIATILDWQGTVAGGPFSGMRYARSGQGATGRFSELLGIYEACLVPVIEAVIARQPHTVINVGAAYGYYAMGFAWRCPDSHIVAYELDRARANLMQKYCVMNCLEARVELRGECTSASLRQDLRRAPGAFLIMDVEGAEDTLLHPDTCDFEYSEMLVEVHEMFVPGVTDRLRERFARTHVPTMISEGIVATRPVGANWLVRSLWRQLSAEKRNGHIAWLHLLPRRGESVGLSLTT